MRKPLLILLALVALLGAACGGDDPTVEGPPDEPTETVEPCQDQTGGDVVSVEMDDNVFEPTCIVANQSQGLHLENNGVALHSFTITAGDVDFDVSPGEETNIDGPIPLEPDEYTYTCKYHPEMTGTITIEA